MLFRRDKELWKSFHDLEKSLQEALTRGRDQELRIEDMERKISNFELDYHNLYEKIRTNLAKLSKRTQIDPEPPTPIDPLAEARKSLIERKLKRSG